MVNGQIENIAQLQELCASTSKRWSTIKFKRQPGVPSELFGVTWTQDNAIGHIKQHASGAKKMGIGMFAISIVPAIATFPVGLVLPAITGAMAAYTAHRAKIHPQDEQTIRSEFPKFQEELEHILESAKQLAKTLNKEMAQNGVSEKERKTELEKINRTVKDFLIESLDATEEVIDKGKGAGKSSGPFRDETALRVSVKAIKQVDREISTRPPSGPPDSQGHNVGRDLGKPAPGVDRGW